MSDVTMDEEGIKQYKDLIDKLHKSIGEPLSCGEEFRDTIDKYTDMGGRAHFAKMLRNTMAAQRLYALYDRLRDVVFAHEYLNKSFELEHKPAKRPFLENGFARSVPLLNIQCVHSLSNFLTYFFDLDNKDGALDFFEIRNYLYIYDSEVCMRFEAYILKAKEFNEVRELCRQIDGNYLGLNVMTRNAKNNMTTSRGQEFSSDHILELSRVITKNIYEFLEFLNQYITDKYSSNSGFDSERDFALEVDPVKGNYIRSHLDGIEEAEKRKPIKIYNLVSDTSNVMIFDDFTIHKNRTYKDQKDSFYRSGASRRTTMRLGNGGEASVEKVDLQPQEGKLYWTHTLIPNGLSVSNDSRFIMESTFVEDLCLLLSLFSGYGTYTDQSFLRYSHKAHASVRLTSFEMAPAINLALKKYTEMNDEEASAIGLILVKYREAMQPMSANVRLVRAWEIIDILGDQYCNDHNKPIPKEYRGREKELRNDIMSELKAAGERLGVNLSNENSFTPIMLDKSIKQKVLEMLKLLKIDEYLEVDFVKLKKRITEAYVFRSKFTHSSKQLSGSTEKDLEFIDYYFFADQLLFVIFMRIFDIKDGSTLYQLQRDLSGFLVSKTYYRDKSDQLNKKDGQIDEFIKYFTGEKKLTDGESVTFSF